MKNQNNLKSDVKKLSKFSNGMKTTLTIFVFAVLFLMIPSVSSAATTITNCTELQNMKNNLSASYELANNIDCSVTVSWNGGLGFEPVGSGSPTMFTGKLDGKGFKISNLYINRPSGFYFGLFGYTNGAEIKNIGLDNVNLTTGGSTIAGLVGYAQSSAVSNSYVTGVVNGTASNAGGLVGETEGTTISNSYATANVSGGAYCGGLVAHNSNNSTISNSYATGAVNSTAYAGGLAGDNMGTISNSYATGAVNGRAYSGGLVGNNIRIVPYYNGIISNSYATGTVRGIHAGGLAGGNSGTISNSYATGAVNGTFGNAGGLVGLGNNGTISNSYATGAVSADSGNIGGLVGNSGSGTIANSYWDTQASNKANGCGAGSCVGATGETTDQMIQQATYSGWVFPSPWKLNTIIPAGYYYPCLSWQDNTTCKKTTAINVSSNILSSWTITGPATITGSGTYQSTPGKPSGTYTITWGAVAGYITPATQSLTLDSMGTISFSGTYTVIAYTLTISAGNGIEVKSVNDNLIDCKNGYPIAPGACNHDYASGTSVVLTEITDTDNYTFAGWSGGGCSGTGTTCTVTTNAALTVTTTASVLCFCSAPMTRCPGDKNDSCGEASCTEDGTKAGCGMEGWEIKEWKEVAP